MQGLASPTSFLRYLFISTVNLPNYDPMTAVCEIPCCMTGDDEVWRETFLPPGRGVGPMSGPRLRFEFGRRQLSALPTMMSGQPPSPQLQYVDNFLLDRC